MLSVAIEKTFDAYHVLLIYLYLDFYGEFLLPQLLQCCIQVVTYIHYVF